MIKIAFLLGGFQGGGGIARVTSILLNAFSIDSGFELHAISYVCDSRPKTYQMPSNVKEFSLFDKPISIFKAFLFKNISLKLRRYLRKHNIDFLVCCDAIHFIYGIFACKKTKAKCICWEHTSPLVKNDHKFQNFSRYFAVRYSYKYVVLTKFAEKFYKDKYPRFSSKILQIYNPLDNKIVKKRNYNEKSTKIISVGRLCYAKNFDRLISIAYLILNKHKSWEWHIFGDGEQKDYLESMILKFKLQDRIFLRGHTENIYKEYPNFSFMVMTSRYEGFPMSLIEGGAFGLPLISFDVLTGPDEIIENNINGFLADSNSDSDMIMDIEKLIENNELRKTMSRNSANLSNRFSLERIANQWKLLFTSKL